MFFPFLSSILVFFFFNDTATTEIYTLSLHDALPIFARATTLLSALPKGGAVVESVSHAASGVTSMWLDNGVRVHHRRMDQRKNEASIEITLAGGQIQETPADRGITEAALRGWGRPATSRLTSTQIRD